jgi:hypothetical protein
MIGQIDVAVEIVEIDPDNQYHFIEGPGKKRIKLPGPAPPGMGIGDGVYILKKQWDEWCFFWDTGAWDSISWHI